MHFQAITSALLFSFWGFVCSSEPYFHSPPNTTKATIDLSEAIFRRIKYSTGAPRFNLPGMIRFLPSLSTATLPPLMNEEKCPDRDGWVLKNDFCYFFTSEEASSVEKQSWRDARKYCVQQGGDLLSIVDSDESLFISQYIRKFADILLWIGGRAEFIGSFKWSDGKPFLFNNWNVNQPNNFLGQEDCLSLHPANGKWSDDNCGQSLNFICKKPKDGNYSSNAVVRPIGHTSNTKGNCPEGFSKAGECLSTFYSEYRQCIGACDSIIYRSTYMKESKYTDSLITTGSKCFILVTLPKSFEDAREYCRKFNGGELASINSQFDEDVISSLFWNVQNDFDYVWIGMKYLNGFMWLDQTNVDYTNWNKGEPNNNGFVRQPYNRRQGPSFHPGFSLHSRPVLEECVEIIVRKFYMWNDKSCDRENTFICQKPVDSTLEFDPNIEFCKYPHNDFVKKGDGCYKVIDEQKSWKEAEDFCQQLGSNLMSIEFLEEKNYIYTSLLSNYTSDNRFWMGMKYNNQTQSFKFSDENPVLFTNWGMDANDSCVVLSVSDNGKWYSEPCSKEHKFICKYSSVKYILEGPDVTGSCPSEQWIDFHGEYCYLFETEEKADWINANIRCQREGSNLASIHSKQEENLLKDFIRRNHLRTTKWIGLLKNDQSFFWSDGTPMDHQNWASGEPNDEEKRCGAMAYMFQKWNDYDCANRMGYVCKIPKIILTDSIPTTEEYSTAAVTYDESSSENILSSINYTTLSAKTEYQLKNPIMTTFICFSSISLLVVVSFMAYYYKRKYRSTQVTLRSGAIDDSVHYHGGL